MKISKRAKKIKLAVFDIDGTVFRSSLLIELIDALVSAGIFPEKAQIEIKKHYLAWLNRTGTYPDYINKVISVYYKYLKGIRQKDVARISKQMLKIKRNRVYRFTRDLIKYLRKNKFYVLALSASPDYLVGAFAKYLGFNEGLGSKYETKNGVYTGKLLNAHHILNKEVFLKDYLKQNDIDPRLKNSIGIGDTESDIAFLQMVQYPIAFNPNRNLAEYARKKGWKIVVERKDVVYTIRDFEIEEIGKIQ